MDLFNLRESLPILLRGTGYTLLFAIGAMIGGSLLGFPLAVARVVPSRIAQRVAGAYVSMIRGMPLLVQVFVIYYGLPSIGIEFSPVAAGTLALELGTPRAYLSETLRGALLGVTPGQWSAGYSLGLTYAQTLRYIMLPQAMRIAVPGMSNTLISLIKDTSLVSVITVTELMLSAKEVIAITFRPLPIYLMAAVIYWLLSFAFERLQLRLERRLNRAHQR